MNTIRQNHDRAMQLLTRALGDEGARDEGAKVRLAAEATAHEQAAAYEALSRPELSLSTRVILTRSTIGLAHLAKLPHVEPLIVAYAERHGVERKYFEVGA